MKEEEAVVDLVDNEVEKLRRWARTRHSISRTSGLTDQRRTKKYDSIMIDFYGACGEYAVCKYLGIPFEGVFNVGRGDSGVDFKVNDVSFDVKTSLTKRPDNLLLFPTLDKFKADAAILVVKETDTRYLIMGVTTRERFSSQHAVVDFGFGKQLSMRGSNLTPIRRLKKWIQRHDERRK